MSTPSADRQVQEPVFKPALILMSGRALGFVAAFAIPVVLVRLFDQVEFGTYKQLFLIFATLFSIGQVGMAESLYYFLPQNARRSGAFVLNTLWVLALVGALCFLGLYAWRGELAELLNNPDLPRYLPHLGVFLMFMLLAVLLEIVMTVRKQHFGAATAYAGTDLARALLLVLPALWLGTLEALMWGAIAFALLRFAAAGWYVKTEFGSALKPDRTALREHLAYALPFGLAGLIEVAQVNFHLYAVSYFFDTATFAIYAVGCLQIPLFDFLMTSTCNVMMVNMREKMLAGDRASVVAIWQDSVRKLALIFFPLVACLIILAQPFIVLLFTEDYAASVPIFMVWTLTMLLATLLTDGTLRVLAETRFLVVQNLIRLGVVLAAIQWFIAEFGLVGAVLVTLLASFVSRVVALGRIKAVMQLSLAKLLPWRGLGRALLIAALAGVPAVAAQSLLDAHLLVELVVTGGVYTAAYYVLLQAIGPMDRDEKRMLTEWLQVPFLRVSRAWKS